MLAGSFQYVSAENNGTVTHLPVHLNTVEQNVSSVGGCITVDLSKMEYLPWDNPHNLVRAEVEVISRRFKDTVLAFLFLIGGPGNVINMAVFYKQGLKERVNLCLFALSLADELYLITAILSYGEQLRLQFTTGERFGPILTFFTNNHLTVFQGFCYVSPVLSAIIASERCHCVISPLNYQTVMSTKTMAILIAALSLLTLSLYSIVSFRYRIGCMYDPASGAVLRTPIMGDFYRTHKQLIDFLHGIVFGIALPGLEIVVVTTTTVVTVVKLHQAVTWRTTGSSSCLSLREIALTRMLVGNSVLFIACILPVALARLVWLCFPEMNSGGRQQNFFLSSLWITQVFIFVNATFNIFVYYIMGSRYRETLWALLGRSRKAGKKMNKGERLSVTA